MSRILKFRAWTGRVCLYPPELGEWDFEDCELFAGYNKKPTVLQQFTGLHDKNGKEIYEGDIIEDRWGRKYIVEWSNERSGWIPFANGTGCGCCEVDMIYNSKDTEVIGNRYENPELLEEVGEIK